MALTGILGPSAPKSRKGNVRRICGGSMVVFEELNLSWCAPIETLSSVGRIRVANLHLIEGRLRKDVPVI